MEMQYYQDSTADRMILYPGGSGEALDSAIGLQSNHDTSIRAMECQRISLSLVHPAQWTNCTRQSMRAWRVMAPAGMICARQFRSSGRPCGKSLRTGGVSR